MSMSTHAVGFKPPDEAWKKMKAVYDSCEAANIPIPAAVSEFFDYSPPSPNGVMVSEKDLVACGAVKQHEGDMVDGFEVHLAHVPSDVKIIIVYNSY